MVHINKMMNYLVIMGKATIIMKIYNHCKKNKACFGCQLV